MKAAFAVHNGRIAPVFDTARRLHVIDAREGRITAQTEHQMSEESPFRRAEQVAALGIEVLVCGAISGALRSLINAYGVKIAPFVAGDLPEVIRAWLSGDISSARFLMPGCRGRSAAVAGGKRLRCGKRGSRRRMRRRCGGGSKC